MNFVILDHPRSQLCSSITLPCQNLVSIRYSSPEILQFYNFAILAGKCLTTPLLGFFWGFEPLNIVGRHPNPLKAHPWVKSRHLSHKWLKSVQGFDLGRVASKKSITRTGQQESHRSVIFHIFGGSSP